MDVDEVKKVNELSKELQKHGIVDDSQDGLSEAQKIVQVQEPPEPGPMRPPLQEPEEPAQEMDALTQKKIELIMQMSTKKLRQEVNTLKEQITALAQELSQVKTEVGSLRLKEVREEAQEPVKESPKVTEKSEKEHPRHGKYSSDDVDLKKVFYFGQ